MKKIGALGLVLALGLGGCSWDFTNKLGRQAVTLRDFLADPQTQVAVGVLVATAKSGATMISCFVGAGSSIALAVEQQANTKGQYATGIIYSASSKICSTLGGTISGSVVASGGEAVVTGTK